MFLTVYNRLFLFTWCCCFASSSVLSKGVAFDTSDVDVDVIFVVGNGLIIFLLLNAIIGILHFISKPKDYLGNQNTTNLKQN